MAPGGIAFAGSQLVFGVYSGSHSPTARSTCGSGPLAGRSGREDHRPRAAAFRGHNPAQPRGKGSSGDPGTPPPQEYPHHRGAIPMSAMSRLGRQPRRSVRLWSEGDQIIDGFGLSPSPFIRIRPTILSCSVIGTWQISISFQTASDIAIAHLAENRSGALLYAKPRTSGRFATRMPRQDSCRSGTWSTTPLADRPTS